MKPLSMHECPECGCVCTCDCDDMWKNWYPQCRCDCWEDWEDYEESFEDEE